MSNESEISSEINMSSNDLSISSSAPVVSLTAPDSCSKSSDLMVSRSNADWVPVSLNEIPIVTNSLNFAINEIRPTITSITSNARTIAPKPMTTTVRPIRQDNISANISGDKTQTVIITTASESVVNSTPSANKYALNKVIPISSQIALVTSPDGTSMLAVPMSSLVAKGNVNIKPSAAPVTISPATLKAKSPIITPFKILPLIASTANSSTITVPTISYSKNVQTLIAPASVSIAKALPNQTVPKISTSALIIPKVITNLSSSDSQKETFVATLSTDSISDVNTEGTEMRSEEHIQSPLPPTLLSQKPNIIRNQKNKFSLNELKIKTKENDLKTITFTSSDKTREEVVSSKDIKLEVEESEDLQQLLESHPMPELSKYPSIQAPNSQSLTPPTLTPVITNPNNSPNGEQQNDGSVTGIEEMDSVIQIMQWKDGIGVLPGSDLKFRIDEFGHLDMINDFEETDSSELNGIKHEEDCHSETTVPQESDQNNETKDSTERESVLTCINCNQRGPAQTFIRQGRFCSRSCATLEATHLKLYTKRSSELSLVKTQENDKKKIQNKKSETIKVRKPVVESYDVNPIVFQTENSNQTIDAEIESNDDTNEEVEDVETTAGHFGEIGDNTANGSNFSWRQYLNKTTSPAAPVKCFNQNQTFPSLKNNFKVGMKLEGVDPQHPSKFCVLTVAEVSGFRMRLHFDGYKDLFDFWVNADNDFIFPAGFCEQSNRKLEPPVGITAEEFNWNSYLQQTRAVAAPKHLFLTINSQSVVTPSGFRVGMKLEAVDRANTALVCVATISDIIGNWLLIHFDGWDDSYDYWVETSSPFIHSINWCRTKGRSLTPPNKYHKSSEKFSWEEYLCDTKAVAVSPRLFKTRTSNNFKVGMKLEVVDKRNPRLVRVCTISHRQSHCIKIHFDGWDEKYDYWVDDDCPDIHPVNWCHKTGHPLQPPPPSDLTIGKDSECLNSCPTLNCTGIGHIRGPKYLSHHSTVSCPYADSKLDYELPDRLGNKNCDELPNDDNEDSRPSPSQSPSPSESNSINSTQKSQKTLKTQQILANSKSRKRKVGSNGPVSPSTNSESAKHSRPSTPSSVTNLSSLQHSIFAMRMSQQQQEAPVCWDRHSKTTLPGIDKTKSKDVLLWSPLKVAEFIDQIPGCESIGQLFNDQLIDGEAFLLLNQNDIVKILGLKLGPAIKIFNSILVIRDNAINEDIV